MSTSLAEQLRRLAAPQTSILDQRDKKKPSLLFDPKEAATFERATVLDIGRSGLKDLIKINPKFEIFETTIFSQSSLRFERAVQTQKDNDQLNDIIKNFLHLISPHFLLKPAQQALEWLINRYRIHEYNRNDFIALILPYHETNIFIRCLRLLDLSKSSDPWHWMYKTQKANVVLGKSLVLNHCASNISFMKFICRDIAAKTKVHGLEAKLLVAEYSFYCTTIMGALEYSKTISEEQISTILPSLLSGMASNVNDYVSSTYMILALLLVKTKLKFNLIEKFLSKLANVSIADIQAKSCLLIVLIYQTQDLKTFPEFALKTLSMQTWFLQYLKELASSGVELTSLIIALCTGAIQYLQKNDSSEGKTKVVEFVITVLKAIILDDMGSEQLLRTSLETYNAKKDESTMNSWYCTFLKELHSIYPETYKKIITLSYNEENSLNSKQKQTLEKVMKSEMSEVILSKTAFSIFDKLCHHDVNQRVDAIRYLTQNYFKMSLKDQEFLKPQLIQRFEDKNTKVIDSLLEFSNTSLIELLGSDLYSKLIEILSTVSSIRIKERILAILTSGQIEIQNETHLFITILPFLFPNNDDELKLLSKIILPSKFAKKHPILVRNSKLAVQAKNNSPEEFCKIASQEIFSSKNQTGDISKILEVIEILNEKKQIFQIALALAYMNSTIPDNCTRENLCKILKLLSKLNLNAKRIKSSGNIFNLIESARKNILPDELIILCIETVLEKSVFNLEFKLYDLTTNSELRNLLSCFEMIICGKLFKDGVNDSNYKSIVYKFLNKISSEVKNQLIILSNFFSVPQSIVDKELQMAALTITNDIIIKNSDKIEWLNNFSPDNNFIISVLFLFMSQDSEIRKSSMNVLENIHQLLTKEKKGFSFLINSLLNRQSEIMLDHEQLPMILYTILSPDLSVQKSLTKGDKENSKNTLNHLLTLSIKQDYPVYVTSSLFKMLSLINSKEILDQLSLVAYNLLKTNGEIQIFNVFQSEIMLAIISKINSDTIDNISIENNSNIWRLIMIMFEKFRVKYILNNKNHYCLELLLDTFDKDVFERLSEDGQIKLICSIINLATNLDISEIRSAITKFFKRIELNASFFRSIFEQMHEVTVQNETKKSRRISVIPKIDTLDKTEWKCGITALEFLQNKKKLHNVHLILPILFDILKKCLDFEEQASLEYPKQLILSCILNCSQKLSPQATKWTQKHLLPESAFNIELIVQCIRATQNPQTHHHALLLLSHISGMFPEQVLHHIVAIFTFMGSSVLRHDDAYSFQIITKIIDIIIPILVNNENQKQDTSFERIIPILRVFVDVLVDVPVHRRVPLFEKLLITFGEKNSLWIFLALVFESHVLHAHETQPVQTKHSLVSNELPKRLEIANSIISQFAPDIILFTCIQLIDYLKNLPIDNETNKTTDRFFGIEKRTPKEFRHFKYTIVTSVLTILGAPSLIRNIALLPDDKSQNLEPLYRKFIITILSYIHSVSKCAEEYNGKPQAKYWKVMLHHCFDILDNINSLLTSDMFLLVVRGLMSHNLPAVRRKAMELLNSKLQLQNDFITETTDNENLFNLIEPLMRVIVTIDKKSSQETEEELNQQTALFSLKLLAKRLATNNPEKFRPILDQVVSLLKVKKIQDNVLASLILCFAELCNNLRVHSLYSLNKFMPVILKILNTQKMKKQPDLVLLSTVTAVQKILDTLPLFLNPFLEKIITDISILCSKWCIEDSSQPVNPKNDPLITKLKSIVQKIAQTIPHRVLIPAIAQSYGKLIALDQLPAIAYAMNILAESIKVLDGSNLKTVQIELSDFFLSALQFRSDNVENDIEENQISLVEGHTVNALVSLVLKLSESSFKPLYFKIFDWATREENSEHKTRAITFYRVSRDIADNLKGLFVLFAGHFLKNAASLLDKCNNFKSEQLFFEMDEEKCCILVNYILQTLNYVFLYDNQNFINNDRFELLMQSIVDQLENTIGGEDKLKYRIDNILVECIGHFAVATADDSLWKQLNYQVLLKTRHNLPLVRLAGLKTLCEMAKKLGEDFLPLLPETIPFLSELLEDEDEAVEAACKNAVQELEKVLGEPLQKYF